MKKKLHPVVLTIAILQVVFGVLGLACSGWGVLDSAGLYLMQSSPNLNKSSSIPPNSSTKGNPATAGDAFSRGIAAGMEAQTTILQKAVGYAHIQLTQALFGLFLSVLMIAGGTGLFFMQSWARWLTIIYGVLSLFSRCLYAGYYAVVVVPIVREVGAQFIANGNADLDTNLWALKYGPFMGLAFCLYPLLIIILLLLPQVSAAFNRPPESDNSLGDFRDRDDVRERFRSDEGEGEVGGRFRA